MLLEAGSEVAIVLKAGIGGNGMNGRGGMSKKEFRLLDSGIGKLFDEAFTVSFSDKTGGVSW